MKKLVLFILIYFLPVLAEQITLEIPFTQFTLPNGLTVILHEDHSIPTVSVNIWYHVGSGNEKPGRTGFAHLFEHLMFEGSGHVPEGKFDEWLESAGGDNNGSTNTDRTNYWENVPSNAVPLALFLESDRMGYLLNAMTPEKVDGQRDVVKNERRQRYENQPYGMAFVRLFENLYPPDYPYHWPTIGSMEDLTAASYQDVVEFFKTYYIPNNASLVIAGDIDPDKTRELVQKWFGAIPEGGTVPIPDFPPVSLDEQKIVVLEDKVQLPRLYLAWITPPFYSVGDAEFDALSNILTGGKNSRLYKRLVYDMQIAQDISTFQYSMKHSSSFIIVATARTGHTLAEIEKIIQEELSRLREAPPTEYEVQRAINQFEAGFLDQLETVGGFGGKADKLNSYYFYTGTPDYFNKDLNRYRQLNPEKIQEMMIKYLKDDGRVILSVVPEGKTDLAVSKEKEDK
jgi:zinc protease